jgi:hypothetical protein
LASDIEGQQNLYFGDDTTVSSVFQAFDETVDTDDGTNITSTIDSKRFDFGQPEADKFFWYVEVCCEILSGGRVDVSAQIDGNGYTDLGTLSLAGTVPTLPQTLPFDLSGSGTVCEKFFMDDLGDGKNVQVRLQVVGDVQVSVLYVNVSAFIDPEDY